MMRKWVVNKKQEVDRLVAILEMFDTKSKRGQTGKGILIYKKNTLLDEVIKFINEFSDERRKVNENE